jgi:hypothetical protein
MGFGELALHDRAYLIPTRTVNREHGKIDLIAQTMDERKSHPFGAAEAKARDTLHHAQMST